MWVPCQSLIKEQSQIRRMVRRVNRNCIKCERRKRLAAECKGEVGALGHRSPWCEEPCSTYAFEEFPMDCVLGTGAGGWAVRSVVVFAGVAPLLVLVWSLCGRAKPRRRFAGRGRLGRGWLCVRGASWRKSIHIFCTIKDRYKHRYPLTIIYLISDSYTAIN